MKNQVVKSEIKKLGRPVNPNSARQAKLALMSEARALGLIKRGRPINKESDRQKRLELKGKVALGRKVDPNSARQKRLAEMELKRNSGIEIKRGRPKMVKDEA